MEICEKILSIEDLNLQLVIRLLNSRDTLGNKNNFLSLDLSRWELKWSKLSWILFALILYCSDEIDPRMI